MKRSLKADDTLLGNHALAQMRKEGFVNDSHAALREGRAMETGIMRLTGRPEEVLIVTGVRRRSPMGAVRVERGRHGEEDDVWRRLDDLPVFVACIGRDPVLAACFDDQLLLVVLSGGVNMSAHVSARSAPPAVAFPVRALESTCRCRIMIPQASAPHVARDMQGSNAGLGPRTPDGAKSIPHDRGRNRRDIEEARKPVRWHLNAHTDRATQASGRQIQFGSVVSGRAGR